MLDNLQNAENRYEELTQMLTDPGVINNQEMYRKYITEHSELSIIVETFKNYKEAKASRDEARSLLDGTLEPDFRELVQSEYDDNCEKMKNFEKELTILLTPKDPRDFKNVIVEIRGGAGGEEAALFSYSLFRMYKMYAERKGWRTEILDINETELGGLKEVVFNVIGNGAYSRFKFESGVHRVQRVPDTESSGRIHTSTATVAVLPEVDDVDVQININDLEINTYRSGGAGGQHINKTDSAIRITHKPSGLVVTCQNERSQLKNKEKAMAVLRSRLYEMYESQQTNDLAMQRKNQVGSGDRSEKIRTYNYPQNRVSDHRINYTSHRLFDVLNGDLDELIDALITTNQTEKLISGDAGYED